MFNRHFKNILLLALCALLIISPQILHHSLIMGADSLFHFNRFYDMASQINNQNWQYFVSMYGFSQSGRIVNAIYGPVLAYFNGFILWLTRSWFFYQIISDFIVMLIAGISMYYLLIQNKIKQCYLVPIAALYMLSYGIFTWTISQQFLSWGAALLPIGVSVATRLVRNKTDPVNIIEMTLAVTLMIQTHMLSSILLVVLLMIFFIIAFFQTNQRQILTYKTLIAALLTILLTANVWGGFIEVYTSNKILPPFRNHTPQTRGSVTFPIDNLKLFFPYVLLYGYQIIVVLRHWRQSSLTNRIVTIIGSVSLVLTLSIIPWDTIFKLPFISMLQFPYRLLPTATVLLLLGLGMTLTDLQGSFQKNQYWRPILLCAVILVMANNMSIVNKKALIWETPQVLADNNKIHQDTSSTHLRQSFYANKRLHVLLDSVWKPTPDYLPIQDNQKEKVKNPYEQYGQQIASKQYTFIKYTENGQLYVAWHAHSNRLKTISVIKYAHTHLRLNNHFLKPSDYELTDIGTVKVHSKIGDNVLQLSYQPAQWFTFLMNITKISWLLFICYLIGLRLSYQQQNFSKQS